MRGIYLCMFFLVACGNGSDDLGKGDGIVKSIFCEEDLLTTDLSATYQLDVFQTGDMIASASIHSSALEVSASTTYTDGQSDAETAPVIVVYDIAGASNGGWWKVSINREFMVFYAEYTDIDVAGGRLWSMPTCVLDEH